MRDLSDNEIATISGANDLMLLAAIEVLEHAPEAELNRFTDAGVGFLAGGAIGAIVGFASCSILGLTGPMTPLTAMLVGAYTGVPAGYVLSLHIRSYL